jgi:peptidyl-prolyl cis-trans isomerase A (cyclophilin A)
MKPLLASCLAASLCLASAAIAQEVVPPAPAAPPAVAEAPAPPPAPKPAMVKVSIVTSEGSILLELEKERAPVTTANFLQYVNTKRYDGMTFYRAVPVPNMPEMGLVQGGVKFDPRKMYPPIAHEPTSKTGVRHVDGTISMGRNAPGTATSEFFIIVGDMPYMDADPSKPGDNAGYAAFGHVVEGMDVVKKILAAPRSPTDGPPGMKGQFLSKPVTIVSIRRAG